MMKKDWLWDRDIGEKELREILSDVKHSRFIQYVALLLSRKILPRRFLKTISNGKISLFRGFE